MSLLLDTHALLWFLSGDRKLPADLRKRIESEKGCFVSAASLWEMAVKISLGKLSMDYRFEGIAALLNELNIQILPIEPNHLTQLIKMKFHHRDPFDRLIIAQALSEKLIIATKDEIFGRYKAKTTWN